MTSLVMDERCIAAHFIAGVGGVHTGGRSAAPASRPDAVTKKLYHFEIADRPDPKRWGCALPWATRGSMATVAEVPQLKLEDDVLPMKAEIERAYADVADQVLRLVEESRLTTEGLLEHFATTLVARLDQRIVGTAALEIHADDALLRSVAVSPDVRGRGIGTSLVQAALRMAEELSVRDVYLLTFTGEGYFHRFGFRSLDRGHVPPSIRSSVQFGYACPSDALVMRKHLNARPEFGS